MTDVNPSHYFGIKTGIDLTKWTNGYDADSVTDSMATVALGAPVTWTYRITNTGNVVLNDLTLIDDIEGDITCPVTSLAPGASILCVKSGVATVNGIYIGYTRAA